MEAVKDFRATFECMGVDLGEVINDNSRCDCPFCGKTHHFYVNVVTGQYDCKVCFREGNAFTFLRELTEHFAELTTPAKYRELADDRGIPPEAFPEWKVAWNPLTKEWLIPVYNEKETVRDVQRWSGKNTIATDGCTLQLGGLWSLTHAKDVRKRRTFLCEGAWDGIALKWLLKECGSSDVVVWCPGAGSLKKEWVGWFRDLDVVWMFDNDQAGDTGSLKGSEKLNGVARRQSFLSWPETKPKGWDIRDHIKDGLEKRFDPRMILTDLEALIGPQHRRALSEGNPRTVATASRLDSEIGSPCTFSEVLSVFKKWVYPMSRDFMDCLATALAVSLGGNLPGVPLWFYMIAPASSGKSKILCSMIKSPKCSFHSTFKATSLVSGFVRDPDPSLLPRLNGLTAILKDGTEILGLKPDERKELYATLRGAFDGRVDRPYGNAITRTYDNLKFNMLIGTTPAVRADSEASRGERFLNIELRETVDNIKETTYKVLQNQAYTLQMEQELTDVVARFLNRDVSQELLPKVPDNYVHRIVAMSQLIALMRAQVERNPRNNVILYRAGAELPYRVASQLQIYAQLLAIVYAKVVVGDDIMRLLRKVMADTCVGFHVDILKSLIRNKNEMMTPADLCKTSRMTYETLNMRLADMAELGIVSKIIVPSSSGKGWGSERYLLTDHVMNLWKQAEDGIPR
jgi:hypothetical protein